MTYVHLFDILNLVKEVSKISTIQERIALLIDESGMTKTAFAKKLNITQPYVSKLLKNGNPSDRLIEDICEKFEVDEDWLRNGIEPMKAQPETFSLDDFAAQHNATALEKEIIKTYFEIDPVIRKQIVNHFKEKFMGAGGAPDSPEELEIMHPPVTGDENSNAG